MIRRADEPLELLSGQISFGELGVLIFFAVSGYLIVTSRRLVERPALALERREATYHLSVRAGTRRPV